MNISNLSGFEISGARLLTKQEFMNCITHIPQYPHAWWLQDSFKGNNMYFVTQNKYCPPGYGERISSSLAVRPVLVGTFPVGVMIGDTVLIGSEKYTVISSNLMISNIEIRFSEYGVIGIYAKSTVKSIIDNWFITTVKPLLAQSEETHMSVNPKIQTDKIIVDPKGAEEKKTINPLSAKEIETKKRKILTNFGNNLVKSMQRQKMSVSKLAEKSSQNKSSISRWCRKECLPAEKDAIVALADAMHTTPAALIPDVDFDFYYNYTSRGRRPLSESLQFITDASQFDKIDRIPLRNACIEFHKNMHRFMGESNMRFSDFTKMIDVDYATVYGWINHQRMPASYQTLQKIATHLHIKPTDLVPEPLLIELGYISATKGTNPTKTDSKPIKNIAVPREKTDTTTEADINENIHFENETENTANVIVKILMVNQTIRDAYVFDSEEHAKKWFNDITMKYIDDYIGLDNISMFRAEYPIIDDAGHGRKITLLDSVCQN